MPGTLEDIRNRLREIPGRLSVTVLAVLVVLVGAGVVAGGVFAYRTYDYVQHDNDFCLTCHLMQDPFQRFARSEHQGLGCKACHQPTLVTRSQMALTQILENPEALGVHAEVPNEACARCHIEGDPEKWRLVSASAGHRVHLESADSSLQGLQCVECHSSSLHEFTATDRTCGQSGCHTDTEIQLGEMADFTIHCAACHNFSTPVPDTAGVQTALLALRPEEGSCLSCHAMRELVSLPAEDPHQGACGACHNPHTQATPAEAGEGCTASGCHQDPESESPFHRGIPQDEVADCMQCHQAHDFGIDGQDCRACHQDVFEDGGGVPGVVAHLPGAGWLAPAGTTLQTPPAGQQRVPPGQDGRTPPFLHRQHRDLSCLDCHATDGSHGRVTVRTLTDCRSCHHTRPVSRDCRTCHQAGDFSGERRTLTRTVDFSVADPSSRALPFDHPSHASVACGECHTGPPNLDASAVDCAACHEEHHDVETASCLSCHTQAPEGAHDLEVHAGCTGSGCHGDAAMPFTGVPRTRPLCLACHQDQTDHRVGQNCVACHPLPGGRP